MRKILFLSAMTFATLKNKAIRFTTGKIKMLRKYAKASISIRAQ